MNSAKAKIKTQTAIPMDTALSPECKHEVDCVLNILIESIEKIQIALGITQMLEEAKTNPSAEIKFTAYWPQLTTAEEEQSLMLLTKASKNIHAKDFYPSAPLVELQLHKLIDLLYRSSNRSEEPKRLMEFKSDDRELISLFNDLFDVTEQRLNKSPVSELNREKIIHQLRHDKATLYKNIEAHRKQLKVRLITARWQLAGKLALIQKYEEDLAIKKWDNNVRIKQEIVKSAKQIQDIHANSLVKQKELKAELDQVKAAYEEARKNNLEQEHKARDEKNDLLLQLQTLIKKFDQTIGDKIKESMLQQEEYDAKKAEFDEFLKEFKREEVEYFEIVRQKEDEERRQHQQRVLLFMMNRAARNVQRYWRKYRRDLKKKSKKKGKGKKKG